MLTRNVDWGGLVVRLIFVAGVKVLCSCTVLMCSDADWGGLVKSNCAHFAANHLYHNYLWLLKNADWGGLVVILTCAYS